MHVLAVVAASVALIVAVPVGLSVGSDVNARAWRRIWPVLGVIGALSLILPTGGLAVGPAVFYAAGALALALSIPARLLRRPWPATEFAVVGALAAPLAGAVLLVADRLGGSPAGSLWWVAAAQCGFAAGMWAAARAAGPIGQINALGAAGAALVAWAALLGCVLSWWAPGIAAAGAATVALLGAVLVAACPARPPAPCEAQLADESARLGG